MTNQETLASTEAQNGATVEIVPYSDAHVFDPKEVKERVDAIHRIMSKMMQKDVHYGVIPGTKKPTLYKPGSEILLLTFRIAIEPEITDLSTADEVRYRIRAFGRHVPTGALAGIGVGECSSKEEKFLWREAVSKEEWADTPEDQRRVKHKKGWDNGRRMTVKIDQIKVPPADAANAVLKRAKKRAQVDFCLTAMAASDIFTQDVEDLPDGYLNDDSLAGSSETRISEKQETDLQKLLKGLPEFRQKAFFGVYKIGALGELPAAKYKEAFEKLSAANKQEKEKANPEGDGSKGHWSKNAKVNDDQKANLTAIIEEIGGNCLSEFLKTNKIEKVGDLPAAQYQACLAALNQQRRGV